MALNPPLRAAGCMDGAARLFWAARPENGVNLIVAACMAGPGCCYGLAERCCVAHSSLHSRPVVFTCSSHLGHAGAWAR